MEYNDVKGAKGDSIGDPRGPETAKDNTACINFDAPAFGVPKSDREASALKLRLMMANADGEDKCTLCKAAEALEKKPVSSGLYWTLPLIMLLFGCAGTEQSGMMEQFMRAYIDVADKERKERESDAANG